MAAETGPHPSTGPHFGDVRTFINPALEASLEAGQTNHPRCSVAVKELFGDGDSVSGYAIAIKTGEGNRGDDWYWYEDFNGRVFADAQGAAICTGCHQDGVDQVLTPYPLR